MREERLARTRTASPERMTDPVGGAYPEEVLLEAYDLEWEAIDLRRRRLQKTWQQFMLIEEMEMEELKYRRKLQKLQDQEVEEQMMRELEERRAAEQEAARRKQEREEALIKERERRKAEKRRQEQEEALIKERERRKAEKRRQEQEEALLRREKEKREKLKARMRKKKQEQLVSNETQTSEEETETDVEVKKVKSKVVKAKKTQPKTTKVTKRITPISLPPEVQTEGDTSVSDGNQVDFSGGYDSPPPELSDDGLLNMLDKGSDSDIDDEPSMMSLILPVAHSSPKRVQPSPLKKKILTPQKRFGKKGGPPLDFNFTNAEAKRQAKAAEAAARAEQGDDDEADSEPEPTPLPTTSTPKKHLKRRKEAAKKAGNATTTAAGKRLMSAMANSSIAVKVKKGPKADKTAAPTSNAGRKKTIGNSTGNNASKGRQVKAKSEAKSPEGGEEDATVPAVRRKAGGNGEKMSIKQRLASAELLSRINKMQDINTPKVLGKKTMKGQKKASTHTLAAKRAEFRKALTSDPSEPDVPRRNQAVEDGDLNISLNSSGLISDNDSPENLRAPTRKRPREAGDGEVTPTKKLQFLEITKRLVKSPMPRFLRTPTPLMSPVIASALVKPKAASPAPSRRATAEASKDYATRRMNSAPVRPKKTTNVNRFGGGGNTTAAGGGFSMFDAFVNSGSSGAIPRLKTKTPGDVSPSV